MKLSDLQIALVANQAGFTGANLGIAVAVALAESGGNTDAVNTANSDGSTDRGLFQINSVHSDLLSSGQWNNPNDNARMAYSVWHGQGWQGWSTYNNGKYLLFLSRGKAAASALAHSGTSVTFANQVPPAPFEASGKGYGWIKYHGTKIPLLDKNANANKGLRVIANADVDRMMRWGIAAKKADPDKYSDFASSDANKWLHGNVKYRSDQQRKFGLIGMYARIYSPPPSVGTLPGEGTVTNAVEPLAALIEFLTTPSNWIRLAYFVFGGALVLFAAYKVSGVKVPEAVKVAAVL
jgi:hypothetical protein